MKTILTADLLTDRAIKNTDGLKTYADIADLPTCYLGASTGVEATLNAAAMVSRHSGGSCTYLEAFSEICLNACFQTLLLVGSLDPEVITLQEKTMRCLAGLEKGSV